MKMMFSVHWEISHSIHISIIGISACLCQYADGAPHFIILSLKFIETLIR